MKKERWCMRLGKLMARAGINKYDIVLRGTVKNLVDDVLKKDQGYTAVLINLNNIVYNELILRQDDIVCFQIVEDLMSTEFPNGDMRKLWEKLSKKFKSTTEASKTRLQKKFSNSDLKDITSEPKNWITDLELLRDNLKNLTCKLMAQRLRCKFHSTYLKHMKTSLKIWKMNLTIYKKNNKYRDTQRQSDG